MTGQDLFKKLMTKIIPSRQGQEETPCMMLHYRGLKRQISGGVNRNINNTLLFKNTNFLNNG